MHSKGAARIELYDTTLRDGTQREGISLSAEDKVKITRQLDQLGVSYVAGTHRFGEWQPRLEHGGQLD
jgi:isopropylmalate/homocitrate/citramalate synthase